MSLQKISIPDNQNRYIGGFRCPDVKDKAHDALVQLSALSVWDLVDTGNVLMLSSFGGNKEEYKNRKFIDLGPYIEKTQTIYTENVMGFLSCENVEVSVVSSFDVDGNNFFLYHMLSKVCGVSMAKLMVSRSTENVLDLLPLLFPKLLKDALHQGLFRAYHQYEYNDMRVKGRIDVARHIRQNIPFRGTIAYSAREYDADNLVTQLIRHTIEYLKTQPMGKQAMNCDQDTRAAVEMIVQATPSYDHKQFLAILQKNMVKKVSHPYYNKYINLQQLCIAILQKKKAAYGGNGKQMIQGVLFDGAWVWEEYVASILQDSFRHYTDKNSHFSLFEDFQQTIIPDYILRDYDETTSNAMVVADAKYMHLFGREKLQGEQTYSVYYKTIMYMLRFNAKVGFIFYPIKESEWNEKDSIVAHKIKDTDSTLVMAGLKVFNSNVKSFKDFQTGMKDSENQFAEAIKNYLEK